MVRVDDTFEYVKINVASPEKIKNGHKDESVTS